jgi:pyruvate formate lyase activating enzyme
MISRRGFLIKAARIGPLSAFSRFVPCSSLSVSGAAAFAPDWVSAAPKARYWVSSVLSTEDCLRCHEPGKIPKSKGNGPHPNVVRCLLCNQNCILRTGERGKCRARMNIRGELRSLVYGRPVSTQIDPIEKKPFYHFLPGSQAFSLATSGCPLRCKFCQNWEISQSRPEDFNPPYAAPAEMVGLASSRRAPVIAFTYNEPTVFIEYLTDITGLAKKQKLRCVMVSCGFMNSEPLTDLCQILDAIKIDLKGFSPNFYRSVCSAELQPVLNSIRQIAKSKVHLEIVNLVVPTLNDSEKMLVELANWVMGEIGPDVPIHFTRFHPDYQLLNLPPTPVSTLERARNISMSKGIHYAYVGNVPDHPGNHTYCPQCGKAIITRKSIFLSELHVERGRCKYCGCAIAGVWS